ncbi:fungal specific transcription factor [Hirsutella rhossiliensis]|uniref:Fungal specific transcription factor domain-containing protein n=1 Tax=Hirsutella rhossiliensis TaxID=111463 RepID=A0A9P8SDU4_9HYPO|nr:fungal specific transcription factor domain-containing protein [Hirsutella rhossiliensis]KAH0958324.1 fungal specific transcription factor domain-containing protein [Hirsutella rhossiliensis]
MPRPRVLPSQRRRAAEACNFCREVKKKCSGTVPCVHCLRRGIGNQCCISLRPRGSRQGFPAPATDPPAVSPELSLLGPDPRPPSSSPAGGAIYEVASDAAGPGEDFRPPSPSESRRSVDVSGSPGGAQQQRLSGPAASSSPMSANLHSRMLLNMRGERVYVGGAASLSFLQVVRRVVAEQIGPSQFSHNAQSDTMLEKEPPPSDSDPRLLEASHLDVTTKVGLSHCFRAVTEGFIDIFTSSELQAAAVGDLINDVHCSAQRRAALGLVIAIGAQVQSPETARDIGQPYFRRARSQAFEGMLEDPDIDIVRCFLLMAFYLLGECRRNAAFMYLGIATRAAVALGLHSRESYTDMAGRHDSIRLRVWISLRIVDMLANSILGRPAATAGLHSDIEAIIKDMSIASPNDDTKRLIASHHIVSIINGIVDTLYERKELTTPLVEQLLGEIQAWERKLPQCLRSVSIAVDAAENKPHDAAIGSIHVSCLYYFAVMLATRPVLISSLTAQPVSGGLARSHIASACLDAAVFLVQTCIEAREAKLLYGNMCIMKALVFAAGLVLGFDLFEKRSIDHVIESAFGGARDILSFLATSSPQAAHYHEILTLLAKAISKQRERSAFKGRSRYVSRILTLQCSNAPDCDAEGDEQPPMPSADVAPRAMDQWDNWLCGNRTPLDPGEEVFLGWDTLEISHWDSFPFVS